MESDEVKRAHLHNPPPGVFTAPWLRTMCSSASPGIRENSPNGSGAAAWKRAVTSGVMQWAQSGRIDLTLSVPADADIGVLDQIVERFCLRYRDKRLSVLPSLIEMKRLELGTASRMCDGLRSEMGKLLEEGGGVIDRDRAVAAAAERAEDVRRRVIDARIDMAVVEARIRGVRLAAEQRRAELQQLREEHIKRLKEEILYLQNEGYIGGPNSPSYVEKTKEIDRQARQPLADDEQMTAFLRAAADLEVEKIVGEERVLVLTRAFEDERQRGLELLSATDLEHFRQTRLSPAEWELRARTDELAVLEAELRGVRSLTAPQRVTTDPVTGELPLVHILGAVTRPGAYAIEGGTMTLTKLIALAGDLSAGADLRTVNIIRRENGRQFRFTVDLAQIIAGNSTDIVLRPDDLVYVGERIHIFGAVNVPGAYAIEGGTMTLTKLIALAGDLSAGADLRTVNIIRRENGRQFRFTVDLEQIIAGNSTDIVLRPDDQVFVGEK